MALVGCSNNTTAPVPADIAKSLTELVSHSASRPLILQSEKALAACMRKAGFTYSAVDPVDSGTQRFSGPRDGVSTSSPDELRASIVGQVSQHQNDVAKLEEDRLREIEWAVFDLECQQEDPRWKELGDAVAESTSVTHRTKLLNIKAMSD